jgi:predicted ATPase
MMSNNALDFVTISGFKSISSVEKLQLRPVNIVIGPNGSGKSNFIGVFSFLNSVREGHLQDYVRRSGGAEQLLHFSSKVTKQIRIHLSFSQEANQYDLTLKPTSDDSLYPSVEKTSFWDKSRYQVPFEKSLSPTGNGLEAGISSPNLSGVGSWVSNCLAQWRLYHVHDTSATSPMRKTSDINDNRFLQPDASNLASFLYLLKEKYPDEYQMIRKVVQRVAPFFDDFILSPDSFNEEKIRLAWKHKNSSQYFGASALSDGTLRFIALTTILLQPSHYRPSVILIDEPELGLHPYGITLLASLVHQVSASAQIILSTQSSLFLDHFQPEDVLVAERSKGGTCLSRLESKRLSEWLKDYSLGQLWEKNELGGRPVPE